MSEDFLAHALDCAPPDVGDTLRWLLAQGFVPRGGLGGPRESFGNLLLDYDRGDIRVRVTRDRGQWCIDMTQCGGQPYQPLNILLAAMAGDEPDPGARREELGNELPDQLPPGVSWADRVPAAIEWLSQGDHSDEIAEAVARSRATTRAYWKR